MNDFEKFKYEQALFEKHSAAFASMKNRAGFNGDPIYAPSSINGVNELNTRLEYQGGFAQQDRMIRDKRKSFNKAVLYSYQGAFIKKWYPDNVEVMEDEKNAPPVRALINPDKNKMDYDEKIVSVGFEHGFKTGDIFEWVNTNTYWLIYLQELTELAYFRGEIRKCNYEITYDDTTTYAYVRGPVETKIDYIQKHGISVDNPNHSLHIYMPATQEAIDYFTIRYQKFYLQGDQTHTCWRVEASDWLSQPGILELNAVEYYANEIEDDIEAGVVGAKIAVPADPNPEAAIAIVGDTFIKPKIEVDYYYNGAWSETNKWFIKEKNLPLAYESYIDTKGVPHLKITWTSTYSGQFDIYYGTPNNYVKKTIVIESLF